MVIQGFKQKSGIDYFDTYALVARISTIRLLIVMASIHNLIIHQMYVKTAFLNGKLDKEVYMNQPQGFIMPGNENKVDLTKEFLSSRFSMKDMGEVDVILGIRIKHESNGISISQSHYIKKVLQKFNYYDCTPVSTPMDTSKKLMPNDGQTVSQLDYSRVIGCLMYAMTCTRPDIIFDVGKLSMYTSNPGTQHCQAIQRVLKYLKKTMDYRLMYNSYPSVLKGYNDASWISNTKDNSLTSGWVFLLGGEDLEDVDLLCENRGVVSGSWSSWNGSSPPPPPPPVVDISAYLIPISKGKSVVSIISRLLLGAVSYYIWIKRNSILFKKKTLNVP
nr:zinc finger, CCHC-type [Tanacetum cinerariifolium]